MRTIFVGAPEARQRACAEAVLEGLQAAMDTIRAGVSSEAVDAAARGVIEKAGFGEYFRHRLGYSIGVNYPPDWGERTISLRRGDKTVIEKNMTFHFMPALWLDDGGLEITESIVITESGYECLATVPQKLLIK
jgi:ectoine hydrolase